MPLIWVVIGTFVQLALGGYMVIMSIFAGGAIAQHHVLTEFDDKVLSSSFFVLPLSFVITAIIVLIHYWKGSTITSFWWYAVPWGVVALYIFYTMVFLKPEV
ncbi:hypothetical protein [Marinomonas flavescens]|uniref:hypothetical protein n=1 Tax=Marinomonas flavescens TaxID=2529379 RepID=UPI00105561CE|nr:hypothetical protein [Marinomonas flavescens]